MNLQIFITEPRGGRHRQLVANTNACWSTILPSLLVRGLMEKEIKPLFVMRLIVMTSLSHEKVSTIHAVLTLCRIWLLMDL